MDIAAPHWPGFSTIGLDEEWVSRLDDIDVEDVQSVTVLGGPAAAASFGRGAAAGVIKITTRQGARDGFRWSTHSTFGVVEENTSFPSSFDQRGINTSNGAHTDDCGIIAQSQGSCTPIPDSLLQSNALTVHDPFRTGTRSQLGVSGSAGNDRGSVYLATDFTRENGPVEVNDTRRNHVLGHGIIRPLPSLALSARAGYTRGSVAGSDPDDMDIFYSGLGGGPEDPDGFWFSPDTIAMMAKRRGASRFIAAGTASWQPVSWLTITGVLGEDKNSWIRDYTQPASGSELRFWRRADQRSRGKTTSVQASSSWRIGQSWSVTPAFGWEKIEHRENGRILLFEDFSADAEPRATSYFSSRYRLTSRFGKLELSWRDRVSLTGGLRHDQAAPTGDAATFPSVGAAWRVSAEPWFPEGGIVSELRVRAAYGEAGQSRIPLEGNWFFVPSEANASEAELGIDMAAFDRRVTLALTHYHGRSGVWSTGTPPSDGGPPARLPGSVRSSGVEMGISATVLRRESFTASLDATAAFPRTRYRGRQAFTGLEGFTPQRVIPDYPVAGYWAPPILGYEDRNANYRIDVAGCVRDEFPSRSTCEVTLGETAYIGPASPTRELSFRPRVSVSRLTLSALLDYSAGNKLFNLTEFDRCAGGYNVCRASQDSRAPLGDQARVVAAELGSLAGYIEDGDYWKFRELSLAFAVPDDWAAAAGARRLVLALAARNLAMWTRYSGADPEVNAAGYDSYTSTDWYSQPAVRYLMVRLDIEW
jgi:hypothetical protein